MAFALSGNQIKTRIIDPTRYRQNVNVEFKLDDVDVSYLPNMRLINLGATAAVTQTPQDIGGLANLIHDIRLYDGREELDSLRYAGQWLSFQQLRDSNSKNISVNNQLLKSNVGMLFARKNDINPDFILADAADSNTLNTLETTTKKAHLDLRELLPILSQMNYLDSSVFKNLRLVIEFQTDLNLLGHKAAQAFTTLQPSLVVDYTTEPAAPMKNVSYLAIEHDEYSIAGKAAASGATVAELQQTSARINGFNNKSVERLLFVKQYNNTSAYSDGTDIDKYSTSSVANYRESWQWRVNGQNLMPTAVDSDSKIQVLLADSWGDLNACVGANLLNMASTGINQTQTGKIAYAGVTISDYVKTLDVQHDRFILDDSTTATGSNAPLRVHVYGEVRKQLVIKGGEYLISYV
tara:strand:+ start:4719 stop:5942 length:1224 start_codon:yes stop_codon:yes gene_type:complete